MKKIFSFMAVALLAICTVAFVSCNKDKDGEPTPSAQQVFYSLSFSRASWVGAGDDILSQQEACYNELTTLVKSKYAWDKVEGSLKASLVLFYTTSDKEDAANAALNTITDSEIKAICDKYSTLKLGKLQITSDNYSKTVNYKK